MKNFRSVLLVIIIALASIGLILGSFSLSLTESKIAASPTPTQTLTLTNSPTLMSFTSSVDSLTPSSTFPLTLTFTSTSTWTSILLPSPTNCPPPMGWLSYVVQSDDTILKISEHYRISVAELQLANCSLTAGLFPGLVIYVPPLPTQTPLRCGRPFGWITYIIRPGDTLYRLSQSYGISVTELQQANCMGYSTFLHVGQNLIVPPWAPHTPSPTFPAAITITPASTDTPEIGPPSDTPTEEITSMPTEPPAPTATDPPIEIPTDTLSPTGP